MATQPSLQMTLFDLDRPERPARASYAEMIHMQPASRGNDPSGSFVAAEQLQQSGLGGRQRRAVYMALRERQGCTSKELAAYMGVDRYTPARRLVELQRAGWVCRGRRRKCRVSGIESVTWFVTRPWIQKPRSRAQVPCRSQGHRDTGCRESVPESRSAPAKAETAHRGTAALGASGASRAQARPAPDITTAVERRRLRERLASAGSEHTRRFLAGLENKRDGQ